MAKSTSRLMIIDCPVCGVELQVYVRDVPATVTPQQWVKTLRADDREFIHAAHVTVESTLIDGPPNPPRTRTKRMTGKIK